MFECGIRAAEHVLRRARCRVTVSANYHERDGERQPDDGGDENASLMRARVSTAPSRPALFRASPCRFPARQWLRAMCTGWGSWTDCRAFFHQGNGPICEQGKSRFPLCPVTSGARNRIRRGAEADESWIRRGASPRDKMLGCGAAPLRVRAASVCADGAEIGTNRLAGVTSPRAHYVHVGSLDRIPDSVDGPRRSLVSPAATRARVMAAQAGTRQEGTVWGTWQHRIDRGAALARAAGADVDVLGLDYRPEGLAKELGAAHYWTTADLPQGTYDYVIRLHGR